MLQALLQDQKVVAAHFLLPLHTVLALLHQCPHAALLVNLVLHTKVHVLQYLQAAVPRLPPQHVSQSVHHLHAPVPAVHVILHLHRLPQALVSNHQVAVSQGNVAIMECSI